MYLLLTFTQNTYAHTHKRTHTHNWLHGTHNPFPWKAALFCVGTLRVSRLCVCISGCAVRAWQWPPQPLLVVLLALVVLTLASCPPFKAIFSLSVFTCILYENFAAHKFAYVEVGMYVCESVCEANICKFQVFPLRYKPNFSPKLTEICKFSFR